MANARTVYMLLYIYIYIYHAKKVYVLNFHCTILHSIVIVFVYNDTYT